MRKTVSMDARKLIKFINESAQSQAASVGRFVRRMGDNVGKKYNLVALHKDSLMYEDVDNRSYYIADYKHGKNNRIKISNIKQVNINESKKEHVFSSACNELVDAICEDDQKTADIAYKKLEGCRFRPTVASEDGYVTTKDGIRRKIYETDQSQEKRQKIVETVNRCMRKDSVLSEDGNPVYAVLDEDGNKVLPITETIRRKSLARNMKVVAESAYKSPKFQKLVRNVAAMISEDNLREAIVESAKFLKEYQEFCMLTLNEMTDLVSKALATQNIYNHLLVEDASLLMYKSNLKVNHKDIVEAWENVAKLASDSVMLEDVQKISEAGDFETTYGDFLASLLKEDADEEQAIKTALGCVRQKVADVVAAQEEESEKEEEFEQDINKAVSSDADIEDESITDSVNRRSVIEEDMKETLDELDRIWDAIKDPATADDEAMDAAREIVNAVDIDSIEQGTDTLETFDAEQDDEPDLGEVPDAVEELEGEDEDEELPEEEGEEEGGGLGGLGGLDLGDEDLGDLEGLEGEEDIDLGGEEGEEEEEEELALADSIIKDGNALMEDASQVTVESLQKEYDRINNNIAELREADEASLVQLVEGYANRSEDLGDSYLAEMFRLLVADSDQYGDFVVSENQNNIKQDYGKKETSEGGDEDILDESQRKSPTSSKKRTRPSRDKKSLMSEDVDWDQVREVAVSTANEVQGGSDPKVIDGMIDNVKAENPEDTESAKELIIGMIKDGSDNEQLDESVQVTITADSTEDLGNFGDALNQILGSEIDISGGAEGTAIDTPPEQDGLADIVEPEIDDTIEGGDDYVEPEYEDEYVIADEEDTEPVEEEIDYGAKKAPAGAPQNKKSVSEPKNPEPKVKKDDTLGNEAKPLKKEKAEKGGVQNKATVKENKKAKKPTFGKGPFKSTK